MRAIFAVLLLFPAVLAPGQERKSFSLGIPGEINTNTRKGYGFAGGLTVDYGISERIAAGLWADYGSDLRELVSFEAMAFGRYYFFTRPHVFAQLGAGYVKFFEEDLRAGTVLANGSMGIRFLMGPFYAEPYVRFGWPTGVGGGLVLGYRFVPKPPAPPETPAPAPAPEPEPVQPEPEETPPENAEEFFGEDFIETPDGGLLYIPEIFFRPYAVDFAGEEAEAGAMEHNRQVLHTIREFLMRRPDYALLIVGFANPVLGTKEEEETRLIPLSRSRAEFIKNELVTIGVDGSRISTSGAGGQGATGDFRRNRRVQFFFINLGNP